MFKSYSVGLLAKCNRCTSTSSIIEDFINASKLSIYLVSFQSIQSIYLKTAELILIPTVIFDKHTISYKVRISLTW